MGLSFNGYLPRESSEVRRAASLGHSRLVVNWSGCPEERPHPLFNILNSQIKSRALRR